MLLTQENLSEFFCILFVLSEMSYPARPTLALKEKDMNIKLFKYKYVNIQFVAAVIWLLLMWGLK